MKRFRSLGLKLKTNISSLRPDDIGGSGTLSMSKILTRSMSSESQTPTAQDLNSLSKYTFKGEDTCNQLEKELLKFLTTAESKKNYSMVLKVLNILDFVFVTGSDDFYHVFSEGNGKWKLKSMFEAIPSNSNMVEKIRSKISNILEMCDDSEVWNNRRMEYQSIKQEILTPTSRHSFESGISPNLKKCTSGENLISPINYKRSSFETTRFVRPSLALSLDRIDE